MTEHRIAILVATFKRPDLLLRLLGHLAAIVDAAPSGWDVDVIVCDNDPVGSAEVACTKEAPLPVRYVHEPRPGIAFARNALLDAAAEGEGHDLVAFIDDDEWPEPQWLEALVRAADDFGADVVTGPVHNVFDQPPAPWIADSRCFEAGDHPTGSPVVWSRTGNVLIRTSAIEAPRLRFHEAYGLSGGSDTLFFLQMGERGARLVWSNEADVHTSVPASRSTLRWVVRRAFRVGNSHPWFDRDLGRPWWHRVVRVAKGVGWMGVGVGRVVATGVRGKRHGVVSGLDRAAWGAGMFLGAFGYRFQEYRRKRAAGST